jgi:CSLREA domain-containing protein
MEMHLARMGAIATLVAAVLILLLGQTAEAAQITVNTTADELNANGNCSLREAIQAANTDAAVDACTAGGGSDQITVPAGTYLLTIPGTGENNNADGDLDIQTSMEINGAGAATTIIDAEAAGERHFEIFGTQGGAAVTISGMTLQNAVGSSDGGSINVEGESDSLILNSSVVNNNTAEDAGGIENDGTLTINDSTISNNETEDEDDGGGIRSGGTLTISRSLIHGNQAHSGGGGISNFGAMELTNVTITGNDAGVKQQGGGIRTGGPSTLNNVTIANNSADGGGGGIFQEDLLGANIDEDQPLFVSAGVGPAVSERVAFGGGQIGTIELENTIVANNTVGGDCEGGVVSNGHNTDSDNTCNLTATGDLPDTDPQLGALASNGGATQTMALSATSPALDVANPATCATEDQREFARPQDGNSDGTAVCDMGAFELQVSTPAPGTPTLAPATETPAGLPDTGSSPSDRGTSPGWLVIAALGALTAMGGGLWWAKRRMAA